jgi:anti-sigma factor NepR-like protein
MVESGRKNKAPALPTDVQQKIGEKLKALYDDVVRQPVPDRFLDLLEKLDGPRAVGVEAEGARK